MERFPVPNHQAPQHQVGEGVAFLNERRRIALAEVDKAPFSWFHIKIFLVAGIGFFTDAYDIFAITIVSVMLGYVYGPNMDSNLKTLSNLQSAALKVATPLGNLVGQLLFGWLADILGRKRMYGVELTIMIIATFAQAVSGQGPVLNIINILVFWRFILGIGVGGDYPSSAVIASEFASTRTRGRLMTAVFACQGLGQLAATLVALVVVTAFKDSITQPTNQVDYTWRLLIGLGCVPAVIALYFRLTVPETPRFTLDINCNIGRAVHDIRSILSRSEYTVYVDDVIDETRVAVPRASGNDFVAYFSRIKNFKVLFGTAYSWFALDIAFYTLTLDSAVILRAIYPTVPGDPYQSLRRLCTDNLILTVAGYIPGFGAAFLLIDVWGRKSIQLMGFIVLTILFGIMSFGILPSSDHAKAFMVLYCFANFFQNFGPNTTTFIVPGEVFPTRYRSTAYGISAAAGKLGAVVAQVLFVTVNADRNPRRLLQVLSFVMMTGAISTFLIPETKQRTLEDLSNEDQEVYITGTLVRRTPDVDLSDLRV